MQVGCAVVYAAPAWIGMGFSPGKDFPGDSRCAGCVCSWNSGVMDGECSSAPSSFAGWRCCCNKWKELSFPHKQSLIPPKAPRSRPAPTFPDSALLDAFILSMGELGDL